ncbi:hypothetical protein GJ744_011587 [Endocarpon pusillum]|uniref:Aminoacyl-transfer RNA synthetases class-II family profile domain-containing protein n=1 Tax=Endocarpon pusillum TaxID=364733 RepID=A0A8H7ACN1_9EURO|nr:hypothetical protein GJ744_011587 [Endocarpon pusillum]
MLWRASPSRTFQSSNTSTTLRSGRSIAFWSPWKLRGISTTTPLREIQSEAQSEDDTSIQDTLRMVQVGEGSQSRLRQSKIPHTRCAKLLAPDNPYANQKVSVSGMIKSIRKQKHGAFAHLTDGSCFQAIQVVLDPELAAPLNTGTCLRTCGTWTASPAKGQSHELKADDIRIYGISDPEAYPIQKKYHSPEFLRTVPHLRIRTPFHSFLARFRSACASFLNTYMSYASQKGGGFVQVQPPIITSSDCEGAGEVFTLVSNAGASTLDQDQEQGAKPSPTTFFRTPRYLTVSSQLHLEAYAADLRNVWSLSPTFRAEKSDTPRHLAEFYMLEIEVSYANSVRTLTDLVEHLIKSLVHQLKKTPHYPDLLLAAHASHEEKAEVKAEEIEERWRVISGDRWKSASYSYCINRLKEAAEADANLFERHPKYGSSLHLEHEKWIVKNIGKGRPIFVTHYPRAIKPFYMAPSTMPMDHISHPNYRPPSDSRDIFDGSETGKDTVACFDLLMPFGVSEIAGGSLREHRLENLIQNMREDGMLKPKASLASADHVTDPAHKDHVDAYPFLEPGESLGSLKWYADLRRYGTMPHGGFGIGWDRLIAYLTGVHNLRDVLRHG